MSTSPQPCYKFTSPSNQPPTTTIIPLIPLRHPIKTCYFFTVEKEEQLAGDTARRDAVLHLLRRQTTASISEIATRFDVSEMTTRRDIQKLADSGQVIRIPGGARIERSFGGEKSFHERLQRMAEAKSAIGKAAAARVRTGESIAIDSGTTTLFIARHLRQHRDIVVVTFSLAVLEELAGCDSIRVELTGGAYRRSSHDLIGTGVGDSLATISADKVFFGAAALSFRKGVMVYDREAPRSLLDAGRERILVIDSSKIAQEAMYSFCRIERCDLIITDRGIKPADLARLRELRKVIVAE
jgi:DeoR/GlpR family transcriptional regulator of sugar metabolism